MYVCLCKAVTDGQIRKAAQEQNCSMKCLMNELGVATQCGKCAKFARQVLETEKLQQVSNSPSL
ncbi:MAG: (2Fe-2S)-binding protein [Pseudomonadota bacterium]